MPNSIDFVRDTARMMRLKSYAPEQKKPEQPEEEKQQERSEDEIKSIIEAISTESQE